MWIDYNNYKSIFIYGCISCKTLNEKSYRKYVDVTNMLATINHYSTRFVLFVIRHPIVFRHGRVVLRVAAVGAEQLPGLRELSGRQTALSRRRWLHRLQLVRRRLLPEEVLHLRDEGNLAWRADDQSTTSSGEELKKSRTEWSTANVSFSFHRKMKQRVWYKSIQLGCQYRK